MVLKEFIRLQTNPPLVQMKKRHLDVKVSNKDKGRSYYLCNDTKILSSIVSFGSI